MSALEQVASAVLVLAAVLVWPYPRYRAAISLGVCLMGAVILHFAAP